MKVILETRHAH